MGLPVVPGAEAAGGLQRVWPGADSEAGPGGHPGIFRHLL